MPDWDALIRARMGALGLHPKREAEILAELAGHLEDLYEEFRQQGLSEPDAMERALACVDDWPALRREIYRGEIQEDAMRCDAKTLWRLALLVAALYLGLAFLLPWVGPRSSITLTVWRVVDFIPFVLAMLLVGALSEYWSKRAAGGERMVSRSRSLWLPGLYAMLAYYWPDNLLSLLGFPSYPLVWAKAGVLLDFSPRWIVLWVLIGAVASGWSKLAGGGRWERTAAALFPLGPVTVMVLAGLVLNTVGLFITFNLRMFVIGTLNAVGLAVISGVALLVGALPFLRGSHRAPSQQIIVPSGGP